MEKRLAVMYDEWDEENSKKPESGFPVDGYRRAKALKLLTEISDRRRETLGLYEPLKHVAPFHACDAPERVCRGSNRSGKTFCAAIEMARVLTNQDPFNKYPKEGKAIIVGKDGRHISDPLFKMLFRPGAMKLIKDGEDWRAWRPWEEADAARADEAVPAPPLVPPRFYDENKIAWESKKENWPKYITLKTGWEVQFCTGMGKPPQGIKANFAWFDEEIPDEDWYNEIALRLVDDWGSFQWSATAQLGGVQLYELCQRAEQEISKDKPSVVEFFLHINSNTHFTDAQRDRVFAKLTDEQMRIRIEGEFAFANQRIYPEFARDVHEAPWFDIPTDWTRYMCVDPGRQVAAAIFCAVPPPSWHDRQVVYFYDEVYVQAANAKSFAKAVKAKAGVQEFQTFIIDHHGGRLRDLSLGLMVEDQYAKAFAEEGLKSRTTGSSFVWGSDDISAGIEMLRSWMLLRSNGEPKLKYFGDKMPNFRWQMDRYHYKKEGDRPTDKPLAKNCDLPDVARYLAMYDPIWVKPSRGQAASARVARRARELRHKLNKTSPGITLGPSRAKT